MVLVGQCRALAMALRNNPTEALLVMLECPTERVGVLPFVAPLKQSGGLLSQPFSALPRDVTLDCRRRERLKRKFFSVLIRFTGKRFAHAER